MINPPIGRQRCVVLLVALGWILFVAGCSDASTNASLTTRPDDDAPDSVTHDVPQPPASAEEDQPQRDIGDGESAAPLDASSATRSGVDDPGCTAYAQSVRGDFDGDGRADQATIRGNTVNNRRIEVCLSGGTVVDLEIDADVRYLAAFDVQGDGVVEIVAATPGPSDRHDNFDTTGAMYATGSDRLEIVTVDGQPLEFDVGSTIETDVLASGSATTRLRHGLGCLDLDRLGSRQLLLIESSADADAASGDAIRWQRRVLELDGHIARDLRYESGTFEVGVDDGSIDLMQRASCGPALIDFEFFPPPPSLCHPNESGAGEAVEQADVDGDGIRDTVYLASVADQHYVGVCLANGIHDWVKVSYDTLLTIDLDRDGVSELLSVGTNDLVGPSVFAQPVRVVGNRVFVAGRRFESGINPLSDVDALTPAFFQWSCRDVTGNALSEVEQLSVVADGSAYRYRITTYRLTSEDLVIVSERVGELTTPLSTSAGAADALDFGDETRAEIDALVPACPLD